LDVDVEANLRSADILDDGGSCGSSEAENSFSCDLFGESSDLEVFGAEGRTPFGDTMSFTVTRREVLVSAAG
jgi:hypothetical protein